MNFQFLWNYISCKCRKQFVLHQQIEAGVLRSSFCRSRISGTFFRRSVPQLPRRRQRLLTCFSSREFCWSALCTRLPFFRTLKLKLHWEISKKTWENSHQLVQSRDCRESKWHHQNFSVEARSIHNLDKIPALQQFYSPFLMKNSTSRFFTTKYQNKACGNPKNPRGHQLYLR